MGTRLPRLAIGLLGLVTIVAYGTWFYAFGVLLDPIRADTGWSETLLTAAFGGAVLASGVVGIVGGNLLDRRGSGTVFGLGGILGGAGLWVAAGARSPVLFAVGWVITGAALGGLGFYHVTQAAASRVAPERATPAIALLTVYGAFASVLFLPLAATLEAAWGWRPTLRLFAGIAAVSFLAAAVGVGAPPAARPTVRRPPMVGVRQAWGHAPVRRFWIGQALAGIGVGIILVYQVPVMVAAGLPAATAAAVAGARGLLQLTGRLPLSPLVARLGSVPTLVAAMATVAVGAALLPLSGSLAVAGIFAVLVGFGVGASSPLQGVVATELFDADLLGTLMGVTGLLFGVFAAVGPALAGMVADLTGSRTGPVVLAATAAGSSAFVFWFGIVRAEGRRRAHQP